MNRHERRAEAAERRKQTRKKRKARPDPDTLRLHVPFSVCQELTRPLPKEMP